MLEIMTASAGSGKTYNLVLKYIRILLENRDRFTYRRILAVTFTNKATDEMKSRILSELHVLSTETEKSPYVSVFVPSVFDNASALKEKAQTVLHDILHDYSAFSVSTIDKFFQQTLKAFSREIGQFASYQVELDRDSLVTESVDRVLDTLTEDSADLLSWLTANVLEQIEKGEKYHVDANLRDMAIRLKSVQRQDAIKAAGQTDDGLYSMEHLKQVRQMCRRIISDFHLRVSECAKVATEAFAKAGVRAEESNSKFLTKLYDYVGADSMTAVAPPTASFLQKASDPELWFSKKSAGRLLPLLRPYLEAPLNEFCRLFDKDYKVYRTASVIDGQIYGLGVARQIDEAFNEIMKEKNVLSIDDTNTILHDIIDGSDAPFIYEKTGVRYDHFLLDEFQDTSLVQWQNFKPLLAESDSRGGHNLIVGDIKQSIYRWRGSDWKLLGETVPSEFPKLERNPLDTNWRSLGGIVNFNNSFFSDAADMLGCIMPSDFGSLGNIYADVRQQIPDKHSVGGYVKLSFCAKDAEIERILESISQAMENGASYSDIAVLVRGNAEGGDIARALAGKGIPVMTDDSLLVKNSLTVRRIVSLMSYAENPEDTVNGFLAASLDITLPKVWSSLENLAEILLRSLKEADSEGLWKGEALYIQSFFDYIQDYVSAEGNNLRGFLAKFADDNPYISSPSSGDCVRVMTVHKSKGLDFNYVILPYVEKYTFYKSGSRWCSPNLKGTALEGLCEGVYDVNLSSAAAETLFADSYSEECFMQAVDNLNVFYVAMTRAVLGLHVICSLPTQTLVKNYDKLCDGKVSLQDVLASSVNDFSKLLWLYMAVHNESMENGMSFRRISGEEGEMSYVRGILQFPENCHEERKNTSIFPISDYGEIPSFPLNPDEGDATTDVRERGRLKFSADSVDFFSEDSSSDVHSSNRLRGVVLHDILSHVVVPGDLDRAVDDALANGEITSSESSEIRGLLSLRISQVLDRGWFPEDGSYVFNETSIADCDGQVYRPDRVVTTGGKAIIIDYKSGEHCKKYESQIRRYAKMWRSMGYNDVSAALWYLNDGNIIEI